jgi:hypothetical protein
MKKRWAALLFVLLVAVGAAALRQGATPTAPTPNQLLPSGALLVLETKDFSSLLEAWNNSTEKKRWLASDNFGVFARSRLFLRLKEAHGEFATAAGFSPELATVERIAGRESALGLYDIGKLEFLYVTRQPMAQATESILWQRRTEFEPRQAAGVPYYIRTDEESKRVMAFAATRDHLLLATREDLLVGALGLLAGERVSPVTADAWYQRAVGAGGTAGALRLVMDLNAITATPHFRSYWVQRNVSELREFDAAVSDLQISAREIREERRLLRPAQPEWAGGEAGQTALAEALRLVPEGAGFYRAQVSPSVDDTVALILRKMLAPGPANARTSHSVAPRVWLSGGTVGSAADLETRIDEEPRRIVSGAVVPGPLKGLLSEAGLRAVLQVESSQTLPGKVFVEQQSTLVLLGEAEWSLEQVREALRAAVSPLWTTARVGTRWVEKQEGPHRYFEFDGLGPLSVAARGPVLVMANRAEPLLAVLERISSSPSAVEADAGIYAAAFYHERERAAFLQMMQLLDHPWIENYGGRAAEGRAPRFFSENLGSLSHTLERVQKTSIVVHDYGDTIAQTVIYRLAP